jgi:DnaJ-class molecular chaperone
MLLRLCRKGLTEGHSFESMRPVHLAQDPYLELGVARTASTAEIRAAFHKLAKQHHPDQNPGNKASEERFKRVSAAFDVIGDEAKRKKFDRGEIDADGREARGFGGPPPGSPGSRGGGGGYGGAQFDGVDLNDIFGDMFGGRGGQRGGNFRPGGFSAKGSDVRANLEIDLEDAILGAKKRISFADGRTLDVSIPAGAAEGQTIRLRGQGSPGRSGPGDALIDLSIKPHPIYRREGDSLVMDLAVTVPDAILGAKVQAPTPEGVVTLTVPKGSNAGHMLRLKGRGVHDSFGKRGDLLARLILTLPETSDPALEKFAASWRKDRPYQAAKRKV